MIRKLRCPTTSTQLCKRAVAGKLAMAALLCLGLASLAQAQQSGVHYWHQGVMPPGAIGSRQLQRGGPLPGYYQPVEIKAPSGALISLAVDGQFDEPQAAPRRAGMLIGSVYRFRVTNIPHAEGMEVFPTIEVIDRLYAPIDQQVRFAIPIELAQQDLELAMSGKFVTRVIYLEDSRDAVAVRSNAKEQMWFEVPPGYDPLAVADGLGRPVAILRMGARLPDQTFDSGFYFGSPPWIGYPPRRVVPSKAAPASVDAGRRPASVAVAADSEGQP